MTPERYQQIKHLFQAALDLDPHDRALFLDESCVGDPQLRTEIEELLAQNEVPQALIDQPVLDVGLQVLAKQQGSHQEDPFARRERIGPYRIVREIGQGGMGVVYEAIRDDTNFRQQVALKVLKRGMDTDAIVRRFRNERQILAGLEHPNIAHLLDGGATEDGLPYFVMEYIEGQPIDEYCTAHRLNISERLQLFRLVCKALQFAHQNLVVHRDLKPSNILVTSDGIPKLLDFGIAKVFKTETGPLPVDVTVADLTTTGYQPMTPAYASPEQVRGESITTVSDVYSLGVVLYELLTGQRPYRVTNARFDEAVQVICQKEPTKPSSVMKHVDRSGETEGTTSEMILEYRSVAEGSPEKLRRRLLGDLDNIVLMALRKEPSRRYSSVEQFSEDIRRHLDGMPVSARQDTFAYRAGKFIRRNQLAVAAVTVIVLSLIGGIMATTWQNRVAQAERIRAEQEKAKAERLFEQMRLMVKSLVFDVHDQIKDLSGATPARKFLVEKGLMYLDTLSQENLNDPALLQELAEGYRQLGDIQGKLFASNVGDTEGAIASYQKSELIFERLLQNTSDNIELLNQKSVVTERIGDMLLRTGKARDAIRHFQKLLETRQGLVSRFPRNDEFRLAIVNTHLRLGDAFRDTGDWQQSLHLYRVARTLTDSVESTDIPQIRRDRLLAVCAHKIGNTLETIGDFASQRMKDELIAKSFYQMALQEHFVSRQLIDQNLKLEPASLILFRDKIGELSHIAKLLAKEKKFQLASQMGTEALEQCKKLSVEDPHNAELLSQLSLMYHWVGEIDARQQRYPAALTKFRKAFELRNQLSISDKKNILSQRWQAELAEALGTVLYNLGKKKEAVSYLHRAVALREDLYLTFPQNTLDVWGYSNAGTTVIQTFVKAGNHTEAQKIATHFLNTFYSRMEKNDITADEISEYAWHLLTLVPQSERDFVVGLEYAKKADNQMQGKSLPALYTLATGLTIQGNSPAAQETIERIRLLLSEVSQNHSDFSTSHIETNL